MIIRSEQTVGDELHVASRRDVLKSRERTRLVQPPMHSVRDRWPGVTLVLARRVALQPEAPILMRCVTEPQRLEWDLEDCHPSFIRHLAARIPHRVPGKIESIFFRPYCLLLDAQWVQEERIPAPLVVKGIKDHSYLVFLVDLLAPHHV